MDGAIFNYSYTTTLTNCVVSGNRWKTPPPAFETLMAVVATPIVSLLKNVLFGNSTGGSGSGAHNGYASGVSFKGSTISGNSAATCGGVKNNYEARVRLFNSTVSDNTATGAGGSFGMKTTSFRRIASSREMWSALTPAGSQFCSNQYYI
jgi:hypothetical protein